MPDLPFVARMYVSLGVVLRHPAPNLHHAAGGLQRLGEDLIALHPGAEGNVAVTAFIASTFTMRSYADGWPATPEVRLAAQDAALLAMDAYVNLVIGAVPALVDAIDAEVKARAEGPSVVAEAERIAREEAP